MKLGEVATVIAVTSLTSLGTACIWHLHQRPRFDGPLALHFEKVVSRSESSIVEEFSLTNRTEQQLSNLKIVPSCGCTTVDCPTQIPAGTSRSLTLHINRNPTDKAIPLGLGIVADNRMIHKFAILEYSHVEDFDQVKSFEEPDCKVPTAKP